MKIVIVVGVVLWLVSAVLAHGLYYGTMQNNWPTLADETRTEDRILATIICLFGPIGIFAIVVGTVLSCRKVVLQWKTK